ncbi:ABC transporter substrate-binding protein [Leptobacterium flavescens]|uniref:ABC transporter substrate-binding protein n=1 Tax=Leptobacterium flavescens TaxID=472055 RepID=A0A6P0UNT8_9FLAO|nr:ABC transporter substrate-binding protein [Leptobacterium flavescens]NER11996.1 ABC transporter substrate-binding protein [Leptobacterium flavescens]
MVKYRGSTLKGIAACISASCILLLFLSCDSSESKERDHLVFRYNEHSNITSLDPAFARNPPNIWPINQIFNGLVQLDDSLLIKPEIAKKWTVSEDALTYTFELRKDVYFHKSPLFGKDSTRTVKASDFVYSFNRLKDENVASPGSWVLSNVAGYEALNDSVLQIRLKQPFPAFLGLMSMRYCAVVPKEVADHYGSDFRSHPIGTGPFKFKRWDENIKLVLRKNELYFEKDRNGKQLPYLEAVAVTFLPDKQSEFLQFVQGNLDFLNSLDNSYKDEILTSSGSLSDKYSGEVNLISGPYLNTEYLGFFLGSENSEVNSELLRKAVNYGFDRDKMMKFLRNGIGFPAVNGFIPKGMPGFDNIEGYTYQPQKAKELIEEYKKLSGNPKPAISIGTNSNYLDFCEYIQRELQKIGLEVKIDVMPPSTLRQLKSTGKLDAFRASWIADYPDAENYLSLYYSGNFTPNGPNYTHFSNSLYDNWYKTAMQEVDLEKRLNLYRKMDSLIIDKAPIVPLYYDEITRFTRKNVKGLGINPINLLVLKHVSKEE